ncbi:MipA/OmpV family protein [Sphingomonas sp. LaA6.9]|uniref:MipA/OmpV family protein n=1 Tax=Sphingomonas sp. LaA6.9 TaxID=2919914 RepID=UPI001F4FBA9A|nr:MipA/OmpV family protein [Sphingomonas sp. LaA6.9]MCJ8159826.1 MipA/OmpV family protein [Sphingomonas sp. LaA6.9]
MTVRPSLLRAAGMITLGITSPALAREDDTVTLGGGIAYAPSYEGSDDYEVIPAAQVRGKVSGYNFFMRGLQFYTDLVREPAEETLDLSFGPVVGARLNRVTNIKDAQVRALGKLDPAFELGAYAGIAKTGVITSAYDNLSFRVSYTADVASGHKSYVITPAIEYGTPLSKQTYVGIGASADYVGDGFADYYYSVSPAGSAASGLSPFEADGGFKSVSLNLLGAQSLEGDLRKGWSLFAVGGWTKMLGDFKRSPVVSEAGDDDQWFGALGIGYTF